MCSRQRSNSGRSQKGVLGVILMGAAFLCLLVIGVMAVDVAHVAAVASELQNATDAAALAGARSIDIDDPLAEPHALDVAARNEADGRPVSNDSHGTRVSVTVTPSSRVRPGFVSVSATMSVNHVLAPILGRYTDTLSATSLAGPSGTINMLAADQAFPLAVSIDALPDGNGDGDTVLALNRNRLTDTITLYVDVQSVKNAAFTSFDQDPYDYEYLRKSLDRALGLATDGTAVVPPVKVGDKISLSDGIVSQHHLCGQEQYAALLSKPYLVLPVVKGYPQKCTEASVVGFVGAKILDATIDWERHVVKTVKIKLIKNIPKTRSGELPVTGEREDDFALDNLSPGVLKLLPRHVESPPVLAGTVAPASYAAVSTARVFPNRVHARKTTGPAVSTTQEPIQRNEERNSGSLSASAVLSAQIGLLHSAGYGPQLLGREFDRHLTRAARAQAARYSSGASMAVSSAEVKHAVQITPLRRSGSPADGTNFAGQAMSLRPSESAAELATRPMISTAPSLLAAQSALQTVFKRTDVGARGAAKPLSITWEVVTLIWMATCIGLVLRYRRINACSRTGFVDAVSWREPSQAPLENGYAMIIGRLARMRAMRESRAQGTASTTNSILGRFRQTSNPWAHTRLSRIRAMRYWHLRVRRRAAVRQVHKSESRPEMRRLRSMTALLASNPNHGQLPIQEVQAHHHRAWDSAGLLRS